MSPELQPLQKERESSKSVAPSAAPPMQGGLGLTTVQQAAGNLAFARFLQTGPIQTKPAVNRPGDTFEQEADRVAQAIVCDSAVALARPPRKAIAARRPAADRSAAREALGFGAGHALEGAGRSLMESRLGSDFGDVQVHTDEQSAQSAAALHAKAYTVGRDIVFGAGEYAPSTVEGKRLLAHELTHVVQQRQSGNIPAIQRQPAPDGAAAPDAPSPKPDAASPAPPTAAGPPAADAPKPQAIPTTVPGLIVDDSARDLEPQQMKRSQFLSEMRPAVNAAAEEEIAGSPLALVMRPQVNQEIENQFALYSGMNGPDLEATIRRQVPGAAGATTAAAFIPAIAREVRRNVAANLPKPESIASTAAGTLSSAVDSVTGAVSSILFKTRDGGPAPVNRAPAVQRQPGGGQGLDGNLRTSMESAFGHNFGGVRVHTDTSAAQLADRMNARAFTVGGDISFGAGEYQPGSPAGDALIAHELAHVVQQGNGPFEVTPKSSSGSREDAFEADADSAAMGAMINLWGWTKGVWPRIQQNAVPALRSGLELRRCSKSPPTPTPEATTEPSATTAPTAKPAPPESLASQFNRDPKHPFQDTINAVVAGLHYDTKLMEGGGMHYVGTVSEDSALTYAPLKHGGTPKNPATNQKPYTEIYTGAFEDGLPLLTTTIVHEYQHVLQMTPPAKRPPGSTVVIPGTSGALRHPQEVEAYCTEILAAEKNGLDKVEGDIRVKKEAKEISPHDPPGEDVGYKRQTARDYILETLWRRAREHWRKSEKPKALRPLCDEARAAVIKIVGAGTPVPTIDE